MSGAMRQSRTRSNPPRIARTGGGGGWGDPLERDPNTVRADVQEEFVSTRAARERYGVVLRENLSIDHAPTERARDEPTSMRGKAREGPASLPGLTPQSIPVAKTKDAQVNPARSDPGETHDSR